MLAFTNQTKNPTTLKRFIKAGVDPSLSDMANLTFNDVLLADGTLVKDATFQQLQNTSWSKQSKNPSTLTNATKP